MFLIANIVVSPQFAKYVERLFSVNNFPVLLRIATQYSCNRDTLQKNTNHFVNYPSFSLAPFDPTVSATDEHLNTASQNS